MFLFYVFTLHSCYMPHFLTRWCTRKEGLMESLPDPRAACIQEVMRWDVCPVMKEENRPVDSWLGWFGQGWSCLEHELDKMILWGPFQDLLHGFGMSPGGIHGAEENKHHNGYKNLKSGILGRKWTSLKQENSRVVLQSCADRRENIWATFRVSTI